MKFEEIKSIINNMCEDYLDGIEDNCDEDGNLDFGKGVGYSNENELLNDFIEYIKCFV